MNYAKAKRLLESAKSPATGKPVANNTRLFARAEGIALRLHSTDVILFRPDDSMVLNTDGWRTVTTKERISSNTPARPSSVRGTWYLHYNGAEYVFADGMILNADGTVTGAGSLSDVRDSAAKRKAIKKYASAFIDALHAGKIPAPSNGDCWYCLMRSADGKTLGENFDNADHIASHIEEDYYVPSLLTTALERMGSSIAEKQTAMAFMVGKCEHAFAKERDSFVFQGIEKRLYRYIAERSGFVACKGADRNAARAAF